MKKLLTANEARALTAEAHNSLVEDYTPNINQAIVEAAERNHRWTIVDNEGLSYTQDQVIAEALKALGFKVSIVPAGLRLDW